MNGRICFKRNGRHNTIYKYCMNKNSFPKDLIIHEDDILNEGKYSVVLNGMKDQTPIVVKFTILDAYIPSKDRCGLVTDGKNCDVIKSREWNREITFYTKFGGLPGIPKVYFHDYLDLIDYQELNATKSSKDSELLPRPNKIGVIVMDRYIPLEKNYSVLSNKDRIRLVHAALNNFGLRHVKDKMEYQTYILMDEIFNMEIDLIEKQDPICTKELSKLISSQIYKLNFKTLSDFVRSQFYNVDVMKTMKCILYSLVKDELSYYELIKTKQVLKKSNKPDFIIFFQSLFNAGNKIFSTKYEGIKTLHEAIIGLMAGNKVREVLPTFIWTYGVTPCNMPIVKHGKKHNTITGCTHRVDYKKDEDYIGMITEYIEGETLKSFINNQINEEYLYSIILTVLYSLKYAHNMVGFIHWDLHSENIQMRKLNRKDYYIYLPDEKKYLWVGGHLATIFDFGLSSMKMNGNIYGSFEFIEYGLNPNESYSIKNDILKLLSDLSRSLYDKNLHSILNSIYMYFTQLNTEKEVDELNSIIWEKYGIFPNGSIYNIDTFTKITIDDLIKFVENMIPYDLSYLIETNQPKYVLSCSTGDCISETKMYEELFNGVPVTDMIMTDLKYIDPKDIPNVDKILTIYLDQIFNSISTYINKPLVESVDVIFDFNQFRLTQEKLDKMERFTTDIKGLESLNERVIKIKDVLNGLIRSYYDVANKSISDPNIVKTFATKIEVPEDQETEQINSLKDLFLNTK